MNDKLQKQETEEELMERFDKEMRAALLEEAIVNFQPKKSSCLYVRPISIPSYSSCCFSFSVLVSR